MGYRFYQSIAWLLFLIIAIPPVECEMPPHYINIYSRVYSTRHGLPSNHVNYVTQDHNGRIWVATQRGIAAYDGQEFVPYAFPENDETSLYINTLLHDSRKRVWMGTTRGIAFLEKDTVKMLPVNWVDAPPDVSDVVEGKNSKIWALGNRSRLFRIDNRSLDQPDWTEKPDELLITRLRSSTENVIWIGTSHGFYTLTGNRVTPWPLDRDISIFEFDLDSESSGWLLDADGVLYRFDDHQTVRLDSLPPMAARSVYDMQAGKTGALWIATFRGLYLWQHKHFRNFRYRNGLSSNVIMDTFIDREGGFWYGSDNGLGKIPGLMFTRLMPTAELPISSVTGLCQDQRGRFWFAANEGLLCVDESGVTRWGINQGLGDDSAYSVKPFKGGVVTCNTYGLYFIDSDEHVHPLVEDGNVSFLNLTVRDETIWASGDLGLFRYRMDTGLEAMNSLLPLDKTVPVNSVFFDSRDWMWVATDGNGLFVSRRNDRSDFEPVSNLPSLRVFSICEDRLNSIWVGTMDGLVNIEDRDVRQIFTRKHGLVSEDIWTVLCDRHEGVWVSTSRGLSSILNGRVTNYDYNDGLSGEDFISNCRYIDEEGRLWFGGMGITIVDPSEQMLKVPPLTRFRYARVNGKPLLDGEKISSGRNTFEFGLMCSSYRSENQNRFRYQLMGYDRFRSKETPKSEFRYTNLPRGKYTLVAESRNRDGQWSQEPAKISFEVMPAWWQKKIVWVLGALIMVLIMRLMIRLRSYQLARTTNRLQEEVRRQTRVIQKQMERLEEQKNLMERQAKVDDLTQLYNRRHFYRRLRDAWIMRRIEGKALSIIIFDLDHFKDINDTFGHLTGDAVLRQVCQEIQSHVPPSGLVARYGGEEIILMLQGFDLDSAFNVAETIRKAVENLELGCLDDPDFKVTVSGGVATRVGKDTADTPDVLIKEADEALYEAKSRGRNCVVMAA